MSITTAQDTEVTKPLVFVFSDYQKLNDKLIDKLSTSCVVSLVNNDNWDTLVRTIRNNPPNNVFYIVFVVGEKGNLNLKERQINEVLDISKDKNIKTLFIFPYNTYESKRKKFDIWTEKILQETSNYCGVIFSGEILDNTENYLNSLIFESAKLTLPKRPHIFNPLSLDTLTNFIVSSLFSMRAYRVSSGVLGKPFMQSQITELIEKNYPDLAIKYKEEVIEKARQVHEIKYINGNQENLVNIFLDGITKYKINKNVPTLVLKNLLGTSLNSVSNIATFFNNFYKQLTYSLAKVKSILAPVTKPEQENRAIKTQDKKMPKRSFWHTKTIALLISTIILIFLLPVILLFFAYGSLFLSGKTLNVGYVGGAVKLLDLSNSFVNTTKGYTLFLIDKNFIKNYYEGYFNSALLYEKKNNIQRKFLRIITLLIEDESGENLKSSAAVYNEASLELQALYNEIGFLESEISKNDPGGGFINPIFKNENLSLSRQKILFLSKFFKEWNNLSGEDKPLHYLVIFQDNNTLRATGGRLKAFADVFVSNGEILDIRVYSVDEADSKLVGQVEPPLPLKKYFNKDTWLLADSNWLGNFPSSSEKIEWFLDKEMDLEFEGTIAVDSTALREVLQITDKNIVNELLHTRNPTKSKEHLEEFLNSLIKSDNDNTQKLKQLRVVFDLLERKNIILSFHNSSVMSSLRDLGWSGEVGEKKCDTGCYSDLLGLIESADTAGSQNIIREAVLNVSFEEGLIKREVTHFFENRNDFIYKTYLRFIVNADAGLSPALLMTSDKEENRNFEISGAGEVKEAGLYVELQPHETRALRFSWESGFSDIESIDKYFLMYRKQPGIYDHPIEIKVQNIGNHKLTPKTEPSLTNNNIYIYNTKLVRDYEIELVIN